MSAAVATSSSGRTAWARNLAAPIRSYLHAETGGAVVLAAAALAALAWANVSPSSYESVWGTRLAVQLGDHALATDLRGWINEGLMTLFFLVVGLEAKRELDLGELRERTRLAIPVLASFGGMLGAGGIYLAINAGGDGAAGWGAAVSTDTALALGVLSLLTRGRAIRLRVFLLTVVVIDDLAALLIIALGYSEHIDVTALLIAVALFAALFLVRWAGSWRGPAAVLLGVGIWFALFESGVDAVIAGLAIGLVTSAYPPARDDLERSTELARSFREQPTPELAYSAVASLTSAISPNERMQYRLHPWTSRVIVPLFALANAGIHIDGTLLSDAITSPITLGIVAAYAIGKPAGILAASWLATRRGARLTVTFPALAVGAASAGIGFTVSLLVATLAFEGEPLDEAKIGVLATAIISPALAWLAIQVMRRLPAEVRARQLGEVAETIVDLAEDVDPGRDHIRGRVDAPVTLLEYGDYECPYCGHAAPVIGKLLDHLGDELRYVFRHLPLTDVHPNAQLASEAAEAAGAQGAYWEMHDRLLDHQDALAPVDLYRHASELGLDVDRFSDDLRRRRFAHRVAADVQSADASGVSGTPTFFINGRRHQGVYDIDTLTRSVKTAARAAAA
ncbi:Na+/H+ antiporter NhaA [Candidatus Solirubrobacter pratensis]|uniref:Na+/H+ antiporter NhaA n=1 Tax=Candidatus Solirubrobacter pratensis TaxID=1298857 RepID=UPI0003FBC2D8|nr:Na+/H+ antiporter NhaA [Candidatus Solirubrobacter pratensis]